MQWKSGCAAEPRRRRKPTAARAACQRLDVTGTPSVVAFIRSPRGPGRARSADDGPAYRREGDNAPRGEGEQGDPGKQPAAGRGCRPARRAATSAPRALPRARAAAQSAELLHRRLQAGDRGELRLRGRPPSRAIPAGRPPRRGWAAYRPAAPSARRVRRWRRGSARWRPSRVIGCCSSASARMLGSRPATRVIGSLRAATERSVGSSAATDSIGPRRRSTPCSAGTSEPVAAVESRTACVLVAMVAELPAIASLFMPDARGQRAAGRGERPGDAGSRRPC